MRNIMINVRNFEPILLQIGESSVHYAGNLLTKNSHYANEDRDMMRLLLQTGGNAYLETIEVSQVK